LDDQRGRSDTHLDSGNGRPADTPAASNNLRLLGLEALSVVG
jgi:hypothetical protein